MKKTFRSIMALCAAAVLTVPFSLSAAAVTEFSDGIYTFSKTENGAAVITDCSLTESDIVVPGSVLGYPVVGVGKYAFMSNSALESVVLPSSVVSIGDYAFAEDRNLTTVSIPEQCESIADNAFFNSPNVVINCWYGSAAEIYAVEHRMPFVFLDNAVLGDVNGDGCISIGDVTTIQRHVAGMETLEGLRLLAADINSDGVIDVNDATALQMYVAGFDSPYQIGEPISI